MYFPLFTVPRLREAVGKIHFDKAIGHDVLSDPDNAGSLRMLVEHWDGLLRALLLAGYRPAQAFVEYKPATATHRLVLDLGTLGYGVSTKFDNDGLDAARDTAPAMLIGLAIDPLWLFGEAGGAPLALLPETGSTPSSGAIAVDRLIEIDGMFPVLTATSRGWLGFTYDDKSIIDAIDSIDEHALKAAAVLADAVRDAWTRDPAPLGPPCGLAWAFDERNWLFPARAENWPDPDAGRLRTALAIVCDDLRPAGSDAPDDVIEPFLTSQVVRVHDPHTFDEAASFGHEIRTRSGSADAAAAVDAYRARAEGLSPVETKAVDEVSTHLDDRFTFTDALLAMIEHGAVGIAHRLLPGLPSTALGHQPNVSIPEWTTPQLTGQWDAIVGTDTVILNQAGTRIAGFWQRRVGIHLDRYILDGRQTAGTRSGGPLSFSASCWRQTSLLPWANLDGELGPPLDVGQISVSQSQGQVPQLTLQVDIDGQGPKVYAFQFSELGAAAHATEASMVGLADATKQRIRTLRDAPLHRAELFVPEFMAETAASYVARWLDEKPGWIDLTKMLDQFKGDLEGHIGAFTAKQDLMRTVQEWVRTALTHRTGVAGTLTSCRDLLGLMFRMTFQVPSSVWLQQVYGMIVEAQSGAFLYQWRLTGVTMKGGAVLIGLAGGSGTFELRRVDAQGNQIGATISRTIDLRTGGFSVNPAEEIELSPQSYEGPGDFQNWSAFAPTNRDITAHLDGAPFTFSTGGASFLGFELPGSVDVQLEPTDKLTPLIGQSVPRSVDFPLVGEIPDDATMKDVYDRFEGIKGLIDEVKGIGSDLKKGKLPLPSIESSVTEGWLRDANGSSFVPNPGPVPVEAYQDARGPWLRFATNQYELTPEFRDGLRDALLWNLPRLTRLGQVTLNGYASRVGPEDYNLRLSRDRAMSALTALYDILGPQFAVPCGDVRVHAFGESQSHGEPESDDPADRRVELVIAGYVLMQS